MESNRTYLKFKKVLPGYLFLLPALFFFGVFVVYPMINSLFLSLCKVRLQSIEFIGFKNYINLFKDENFRKSLYNTVLMVLGNVPLVLVFSFFVSIVVYNKSEFVRSFTRAAFYLPAVSSVVTIGLVWKWIYNPICGILNYMISVFGIEGPNWLGDKRYALISLIVVLFTLSAGQPIILFIASIGNIPETYLEAAEIDGATRWLQVKKIIWPLVKPTSLYIIVITTINSFQTFAIVQLLTGGGPFYSTSTIVFQLYKTAFEFGEFGLATAMGVILAVIVVAISVFQYKYLSTDVEY
jgi:multiple sugar transport system permease protein